jgi:hypothetical protein
MGRVHFLCLPKENEPKEKAPLMLACGSTALLDLSGVRPKLAALKHWPAVTQINLRYSSA